MSMFTGRLLFEFLWQCMIWQTVRGFGLSFCICSPQFSWRIWPPQQSGKKWLGWLGYPNGIANGAAHKRVKPAVTHKASWDVCCKCKMTLKRRVAICISWFQASLPFNNLFRMWSWRQICLMTFSCIFDLARITVGMQWQQKRKKHELPGQLIR